MQRAIWPLTCFKKHTVNQLQLKSDQTLHQTVERLIGWIFMQIS